MICGETLRNGISNETICNMTGVENIKELLVERIAMVWASGKER